MTEEHSELYNIFFKTAGDKRNIPPPDAIEDWQAYVLGYLLGIKTRCMTLSYYLSGPIQDRTILQTIFAEMPGVLEKMPIPVASDGTDMFTTSNGSEIYRVGALDGFSEAL